MKQRKSKNYTEKFSLPGIELAASHNNNDDDPANNTAIINIDIDLFFFI